jgi:hypothetical protein
METKQSLEDIKKEISELLLMTDTEFSDNDDFDENYNDEENETH